MVRQTVLVIGGSRLQWIPMLLGLGFDCRRVFTLERALEVVGERPVDAIICELGKRLSGLDLVIRLREGAPETPILCLSEDRPDRKLVKEVLRVGANRCLSQSSSAEELRRVVRGTKRLLPT